MGDKLVGMKAIAADLGICPTKLYALKKRFQVIDPAPMSFEERPGMLGKVAWTYPEWIRPWYFRVCQRKK